MSEDYRILSITELDNGKLLIKVDKEINYPNAPCIRDEGKMLADIETQLKEMQSSDRDA